MSKPYKGNTLIRATPKMRQNKLVRISLMAIFFYSNQSVAATFPLPPVGEHIVGELQSVQASRDETLLDMALRYDLGHEEIVAANPDIDRWLPRNGAWVTLPTQFILPDAPRKGIVINLPEMRLYYYPEPKPGEQAVVITHPISIGSEGRNLPMGLSQISEKRIKPSWRVPKSIRAEHEKEGDPLPAVVPPGPDNPLGEFSMRLGSSSYLIHGTNRTFSIGMRVSHGCIRLYPDDIASLFPQVPSGTAVNIINQPFKAGWLADELYVEAHAPLREDKFAPNSSHSTEMVSAVIKASHVVMDEMTWEMTRLAAEQRQGVPTKILATTHGESLLRTTANQRPDLIPGDTWWLQAGAFQQVDNAKFSTLQLGQLPPQLNANLVSNGRLCRIVIGPFAERNEALKFGKDMQSDKETNSFLLHGSSLNGYRFCQSEL